jgi:hypothetical protein
MTTWANALWVCGCGHYGARPFEVHECSGDRSRSRVLDGATLGRLRLQGIARARRLV